MVMLVERRAVSTVLDRALTIFNSDDFEARSPDELSFTKGDRIELIERDDDFGDGWYLGKHLNNGKTGLFPEGRVCSAIVVTRGRADDEQCIQRPHPE